MDLYSCFCTGLNHKFKIIIIFETIYEKVMIDAGFFGCDVKVRE